MPVPNFELITELQTLHRRDFPLADVSLLAPVGANPLLDGEFLELDGNYKLARLPENAGHVGVGATKEGANANVYPVHTERGRYDTQAIGKVNILMLGMYEAETRIVDADFLAAAVVGDILTVHNVTIGGVAGKRGLAKKTGAAVIAVGVVSKVLPTKIRFVHFGNQFMA